MQGSVSIYAVSCKVTTVIDTSEMTGRARPDKLNVPHLLSVPAISWHAGSAPGCQHPGLSTGYLVRGDCIITVVLAVTDHSGIVSYVHQMSRANSHLQCLPVSFSHCAVATKLKYML